MATRTARLLTEDGGFLLLEDGGHILLDGYPDVDTGDDDYTPSRPRPRRVDDDIDLEALLAALLLAA